MRTLHLCLLAATAGVFPLHPSAARAATEAGEIIVTASRAAEPLDQTLAAVTVITREDIERLQAQDLPDLFNGLPGLSVSANGGPGKSTSLFLRGTESDHVLVLIDGIKVGSATLGTTPFEQIPLDQIERIEIVRGPRSSLYGAEALGGVLQIFTRKAGGPGFVPSFSVGGGTRGDGRFEAGVRGGAGAASYGVGLSGRTTDGINVQPGSSMARDRDKDPFHSLAGSARVGYRFGERAEIGASFLQAQGESDFDSSFGGANASRTRNQVIGLSGRFQVLDPWTLNLSAGQSRDESENREEGTFASRFDTRRDHYSLINELRLAPGHQFSLGGDRQNDRVSGTTTYDESARDNTGVFLLYRGQLGGHEFSASGRSDDNEQFDRNETGSLAYGYRFGSALRASASFGTAFKAPSFNELYFPGFGNAALKPEKSRSVELALSGTAGPLQWALNGFETRVEELIAFDAAISAPANIDEARIRGVELQGATRWNALRLRGYYTRLAPENDGGGPNDGNTLPRRREQSGRLEADYALRSLSLGATLFAASDGYDNLANTRPLGGYATLDLRLAWQALPEWLLQLEGRNVLDKDYETAAGFATYGAGLMATIRYTPPGT